MGPPVWAADPASSSAVRGGRLPSMCWARPSTHSTSSASTPQILAARARRSATTLRQASITAMPVAWVTRLPPVMSVYPTDSVSATIGVIR